MSRRKQPEGENSKWGGKAHVPKRSTDEQEAYRRASPQQKADMNREHLKRERANCQESDCDNDATNFESEGVLGWCLRHFFGSNDD